MTFYYKKLIFFFLIKYIGNVRTFGVGKEGSLGTGELENVEDTNNIIQFPHFVKIKYVVCGASHTLALS